MVSQGKRASEIGREGICCSVISYLSAENMCIPLPFRGEMQSCQCVDAESEPPCVARADMPNAIPLRNGDPQAVGGAASRCRTRDCTSKSFFCKSGY